MAPQPWSCPALGVIGSWWCEKMPLDFLLHVIKAQVRPFLLGSNEDVSKLRHPVRFWTIVDFTMVRVHTGGIFMTFLFWKHLTSSLLFPYTVLDRRRGREEETEMRPFISSFESSGIPLNPSHVNFIFVALKIFFFQPKLAWDLSQLYCRDHRVFSSTRDLIAVIYYSHLSDSGFIICDSFTGTKSTRHSVEYINMLSSDRVSVTYCQH